MIEQQLPDEFYLLGWHVQLPLHRMVRGSTQVRLEPRLYALLVTFLKHQGSVVTRELLESEVWPNAVVGYDTLSNAVGRLRKAFEDDSRSPGLIETIPKTGYRMVAKIEAIHESGTTETRNNRGTYSFSLAAITIVSIFVISSLLDWRPSFIKGESLEASNVTTTKLSSEPLVISRLQKQSSAPYEAFIKGWEHYRRKTPKDFGLARRYFEEAIAYDPQYAKANAALAILFWETRRRDWSPSLGLDWRALRQGANTHLERGDAQVTVIGLMATAKIHIKLGEYQTAIRAAERAIQLAPNDIEARSALAEVLVFSGRPKQALNLVLESLQLDPLYQSELYFLLGMAEFGLEKFEAAAISLEKALRLNPEFDHPARVLAATYAYLDKPAKASATVKTFSANPGSKWDLIDSTILMIFPYQFEIDRQRLAKGLLGAGMKPDGFTL